jgi:hypothetical protein
MWTYLLGPFFSLFPKPWRDALPFCGYVRWEHAAAVGGLAESTAALLALMHWYSYAMSTWVSNGLDTALTGKMGAGITDIAIGSAAYTVWITHPVTWLLSYFAIEGTVRLCSAAFTGGVFGTLPLAVLDKLLFAPFRPRPAEARAVAASPINDRPSFLDMICDRRLLSGGSEVADEVFYDRIAGEDFLEIYAGRRKKGWAPPRVVRCQDSYYRLESCSRGSNPRPFRYKLRRLEAGVPGRTVLLYALPEVGSTARE